MADRVTRKEMAEHLGISEKWLTQLFNDGWIPRDKKTSKYKRKN